MFNLKVIFLMSCLVVATTAEAEGDDESETILAGAQKQNAEKHLKELLSEVAVEGGPTYTALSFDKVSKQGNLYKFQVHLNKDSSWTKDCRVALNNRDLTVTCPGEPDFRTTV